MQYRNLLLLALSLGLTTTIAPSISIAQPTTTIAPNADRLPVAKYKPDSDHLRRDTKSIFQEEAIWLKSTEYAKRHEKLLSLKRDLLSQAMDVYGKSQGPEVEVPSSQTVLYFAEVDYGLPKSGIAASLYAESLADSATSQTRIDEIYDPLFIKHPHHPVLLASYHSVLLINYNSEQHNHKLPEAQLTKLSKLYDRAIAEQPQNLYLYLDKAAHTTESPDIMLQIWQAASTKMPNNPEVAAKFAQLILEKYQDVGVTEGQPIAAKSLNAQTIATTVQRLEGAIAKFPNNIDLYDTYANLHIRTKAPQKALPILQAGLKQGADKIQLRYLIGDAHLLSGGETEALGSYQKIVEARVPLCKINMAERFKALKDPGQQRTMLNWMIQSLEFDSKDSCATWLAQISTDPGMNQRFGQEMITAIKPIAESKNSIEVRQLLLGIMRRQQQYEQIVQLGPKFLPANGVELEGLDFFIAEAMVLTIAKAHEKLGNLDQAAQFYTVLGEYDKQVVDARKPTDQRISYAANWHLGRIAWQQKKAYQAIKLLQTVVDHPLSDWKPEGDDDSEGNSYRALAHNLLGEIFQSQGHPVAAKRSFEAAVKADQNYQLPKENLAKLK
jgi:predicted negative regulator of RcsB-dependent stress response